MALYRAADFLLLSPIWPIIQLRLGDHCDEKLKWLCTRGNSIDPKDQETMLWVRDIANGIEEAYSWNTQPIKKMLTEFVWAGRRKLLRCGFVGVLRDDRHGVPAFIQDMVLHCAMSSWQREAVWAPYTGDVILRHPHAENCARCKKALFKPNSRNSHGQIRDPFTLSGDNRALREWCKECSSMSMIPWRKAKP